MPSGQKIELFAPPYLVATKIEAYEDRGDSDYLTSEDFEDIIILYNGRHNLLDETATEDEVRQFIRNWFLHFSEDELIERFGAHLRDYQRAEIVVDRLLKAYRR